MNTFKSTAAAVSRPCPMPSGISIMPPPAESEFTAKAWENINEIALSLAIALAALQAALSIWWV